jgi:hypothetical protein
MEAYEELEVIGTGAFGKVCKIRRRVDNKVCVQTTRLTLFAQLNTDLGVERVELWNHE